MNKKGQLLQIILVLGGLILIVVLGFAFAFGSSMISLATDELTPIVRDLGMAGDDINLSSSAGLVYDPIESIISNFTWLGGVLYVLCLGAILIMASAYRFTGNKSFVILYVLSMFVLILFSILLSNSYEDWYNGTEDYSEKLREQALLSWMIIYSPMVISILGFVAGIILFSGGGGEYE